VKQLPDHAVDDALFFFDAQNRERTGGNTMFELLEPSTAVPGKPAATSERLRVARRVPKRDNLRDDCRTSFLQEHCHGRSV
jgi:hypothetical protein